MRINKVAKNASWIVGCKIAQSGFALLINALTARYFGPSNFGLLNYAASLVAFVTPIMTLGTTEILVNELIKTPKREGEIIGTSIVMTMISSICCIVGISTFMRVSNPDDSAAVMVVSIYSLLLIPQSLEQIQYWFHARYLSKYVSITAFFAYLLVSLYKIILLIYRKSVYWFALSNCLDHLLIAVTLLVIYWTKTGTWLSASRSVAKELWDLGKHYILPGLMGLVLAQSDRVMLRWTCGDTEVGLYSAAYSIAGLSSFVFNAIVTSFCPTILEAKKKSKCQFDTRMIQCYGIITYLAIVQSIFITVLAEYIVRILYGSDYYQAIPVLKVVVWYTMFSYIGAVRTVWILAESKQKYLWIISFSGMVLNILLNLVLIPKLQSMGAAIATLITQFFTNIVIVACIKPLRINIEYIFKGLNIKNMLNNKFALKVNK